MSADRPPTCAEILADARAALDDNERWFDAASDAVFKGQDAVDPVAVRKLIAASRTREPRLAAWVERVLGAPSPVKWIDAIKKSGDSPIRVSFDEWLTPEEARACAAALLRAADEAEGAGR